MKHTLRKIQSFTNCFHKKKFFFERKFKIYYFFGRLFNMSLLSKWFQTLYDSWECSIKPSFSFVKFCKRIGFFTVGIPYWLIHIIWMPNLKIICFFFSVLYLCFKISLFEVPMYMFFGNIFQIIEFKIFRINLSWCCLYQNGCVGIWSIHSILLV